MAETYALLLDAGRIQSRGAPRRRDPAASAELEQQGEQRQRLQRMHADEVRNAQISADGAPAEQGQAGPAVSDTDRVSTGDALPDVQLVSGRAGHEKGEAHAEQRDRDARANRRLAGGVGAGIAPQGGGDDEGGDPQGGDRGGHDRPERRGERCRDGEVDRDACGGRTDDDDELDRERHGDDRAGPPRSALPAGEVADDPRPGDGLDHARDC
jgi:hypothetical protein